MGLLQKNGRNHLQLIAAIQLIQDLPGLEDPEGLPETVMPLRHWLIPSLATFCVLIIGAFGVFTLLIALNGFPEAVGGAILLAYGVLFLFLLIGAGVAQWAALKFITARTQWPLWLAGPVLVVATVLAVGAALAVGVLVMMLAFGAT